ncbi:MAG: hypothetical protein RJB61_1544 [Actinomycetota bacterium]|jgi:hypothetical protein
MIRPARLRRAEHLIDSSGVVEVMTSLLRVDDRGRPYNPNKLRVFLIGLYLTVENRRSATIKDVADTVHDLIDIDDQYRLGIRSRTERKLLITKGDFYYVTKTITARLGYGDSVPKYREFVDDNGVLRCVGITDEERSDRHQAVNDICRRLLATTHVGPPPVAFAIDATGIWSWGKGPRKPSKSEIESTLDDPDDADRLIDNATGPSEEDGVVVGAKASHDGDAGWGVKTAKDGNREVFFGYHEHTIVQVPGPGEHPDAAPRLIRAFELTPANADIVDVSMRVLDQVDAGQPGKLLLADNHYHYKKFHRWLQPLRAKQWDPLHDLRVNEQGFTEFERMRWAAGHAHCPATPDGLGTIARPGPTETSRDAHVAFRQQLNLRQHYAMKMHSLPDLDGSHRVACPALDGRIGCPLRAGTTAAATAVGQPVVANPPSINDPEGLPKCCTQQTELVRPPESIAKLYQSRYWGSEEWADLYSRRTYVEGSYGNRKNGSTENLRRGLFRITGLPLVNLMLTMVNMSYNVRMTENWRERCIDAPKGSDPLGAGHPLIADDSEVIGYRVVTFDKEYGDVA